VLKKPSSQEPQGQFQPNLIGNNAWGMGRTSFGHSLIKEYIWQKTGERYRPIGPLVS